MKYYKFILLILIFVLIGGCQSDERSVLIVSTKSGQEVQTEYSNLGGYPFNIKIPMDFMVVNDNDAKSIIKLTNSQNSVFINANKTSDSLSNVKKVMTDKNIIKEEAYKVERNDVLHYTFIQDDLYHDAIYFEYDNALIEIDFNCLDTLQEEWESVGNFIIRSLMYI